MTDEHSGGTLLNAITNFPTIISLTSRNGSTFCKKQDMSLELWANEVCLASSVLIANGHAISEREKTMVFQQGLFCEDLQSALILPSRTETFEQLVESARSYIQSTISVPLVLSTSQRIFLANTEPVHCTICL